MEISTMPVFIRESTILTPEEKNSLCTRARLPVEEEVDQIRLLPEVRDLLQAFIGDESTRNTHLQLKAKEYIALGDIDMAWRVLLL